MTYEVKVKENLDVTWSDWFESAIITLDDDGYTCLSVTLPDQAALYGLLRKLRDLNLTIISIIQITDVNSTR